MVQMAEEKQTDFISYRFLLYFLILIVKSLENPQPVKEINV